MISKTTVITTLLILSFFIVGTPAKPTFFDILARPRRLCGKNLDDFVTSLCKLHNAPHPGGRVRRNIAKECCHQSCNLSHVVYEYCLEINEDALLKQTNDKNLVKEFVWRFNTKLDTNAAGNMGKFNLEFLKDVDNIEPCEKHKRNKGSKSTELALETQHNEIIKNSYH